MKNTKKEVGQRIKELRGSLTQKQVADILKMDRGNFSKCELGIHEFNYDMLIALAKHFNVSTDYILGLTIHTDPAPK